MMNVNGGRKLIGGEWSADTYYFVYEDGTREPAKLPEIEVQASRD